MLPLKGDTALNQISSMAKTKVAKAAPAATKGKKGAKAEPVKKAPPPKVRFREVLRHLIWDMCQLLQLWYALQVEESSSEESSSEEEEAATVVKTNGAAKVYTDLVLQYRLIYHHQQTDCSLPSPQA